VGCLFQVQIGAVRAQEAYPRSRIGRFEVDGLDFRPEGAWRKGSERVRSNRAGLLGLRALSLLNGRSPMTRVAGTYFVPSSHHLQQHGSAIPAAQYENVLFTRRPPRAVQRPQLLQEMSEDRSPSAGWCWMGRGRQRRSVLRRRLQRRRGEGLMSARRAPSQPAPRGAQGQRYGRWIGASSTTTDRMVCRTRGMTTGVDSSPSAAQSRRACGAPGIWAHRYFMSAWNGSYPTKSPRRGAGGDPSRAVHQVDDYTMQSAVGGATACIGSAIMPVGTVAPKPGMPSDFPISTTPTCSPR
jgi:hypothetical protein